MNQEALRALLQHLSQPLVNIVTTGQGATVTATTCVTTPATDVQRGTQTTRQTSVHTSAPRASLETPPQTVSQPQTYVPAESGRDKYCYKVKIINPSKKSEVIVRQLNNCTSKFKSVSDIRIKLIDQFGEQVPSTLDFTVGYYDGSQQAKVWLCTTDDLNAMYSKHPNGGSLSLWCDGKADPKRKREVDSSTTYRHQKEEEAEAIYKELREKHSSMYDSPRLRLWARMISSGLHEDYYEPPDIPAFSGNGCKRPRRDSLSDSLSGAAVAFASALNKGNNTDRDKHSTPSTTEVVSSSQAIELRMKNYEQLRYLQSLLDDGILNEEEYVEQKKNILLSLRKLS